MKRKTLMQIKELKKDFKQVNFKLDLVDYFYLENLAREDHRSLSGLIKHIIALYLNERNSKKENATNSNNPRRD